MGVINTIVRVGKYILSGEDTVTLEQWETAIERTEDTDLIGEWRRTKTIYGAAHVNPNHLSDKMLALYMQCITEHETDEGKFHVKTKVKTISHSEMRRIERYNRGN